MNNKRPATRTTTSNRAAPKNKVPTQPTRTPPPPPPPAPKTFRYNSLPDIISVIIWGFVVIVAFFIVNAFFGGIPSLVFVLAACIPIVSFLINIYVKSAIRMTVTKDEIIFRSGTLTQRTQSIPTNKIRYCSKTSGVLQRLFDTMTIGINTAGDSAEITFENIKNGDEAYELISQFARRNGSDGSRA